MTMSLWLSDPYKDDPPLLPPPIPPVLGVCAETARPSCPALFASITRLPCEVDRARRCSRRCRHNALGVSASVVVVCQSRVTV